MKIPGIDEILTQLRALPGRADEIVSHLQAIEEQLGEVVVVLKDIRDKGVQDK